MPAAELLQYNVEFDRVESDTGFIKTQIESYLRERLNVLISKTEYHITDDHLVRKGKREPFIDSIKRGRDVIQSLDPRPVDFDREAAEVIGFEQTIDPFLSNPKTPLGSKVLSISLRGEEGSKYGHNFYDIFTLRARDEKRYVELSRYSSALEAQEYARRLPGLDPDNPPSAAEFLANPIVITDIFITAEQIHEMLHEEHDYTAPVEFDNIWSIVSQQDLIDTYILKRNGRSLNAILNFTDKVNEDSRGRVDYRDYMNQPLSRREISILEESPVCQTIGPCPGKSGADINSSPYSVSEFGNLKDDLGDREFECPVCQHKNLRPYNEKISSCQNPMCPDPTKVACV